MVVWVSSGVFRVLEMVLVCLRKKNGMLFGHAAGVKGFLSCDWAVV